MKLFCFSAFFCSRFKRAIKASLPSTLNTRRLITFTGIRHFNSTLFGALSGDFPDLKMGCCYSVENTRVCRHITKTKC
jgi:hypothetical protein